MSKGSHAQITVVGRLGRDPEIRSSSGGKAFATMALAVTQGWGNSEKTIWFDVVVFGDQTVERIGQYLNKGCRALVIGEPSLNVFEKRDGTSSASIKITVGFGGHIEFLDMKDKDAPDTRSSGANREDHQPPKKAATSTGFGDFGDDLDDDLPF